MVPRIFLLVAFLALFVFYVESAQRRSRRELFELNKQQERAKQLVQAPDKTKAAKDAKTKQKKTSKVSVQVDAPVLKYYELTDISRLNVKQLLSEADIKDNIIGASQNSRMSLFKLLRDPSIPTLIMCRKVEGVLINFVMEASVRLAFIIEKQIEKTDKVNTVDKVVYECFTEQKVLTSDGPVSNMRVESFYILQIEEVYISKKKTTENYIHLQTYLYGSKRVKLEGTQNVSYTFVPMDFFDRVEAEVPVVEVVPDETEDPVVDEVKDVANDTEEPTTL